MPSGPMKSSETCSSRPPLSRASAAACMAAMVLRRACSGGSRLQPARASRSTASAAANALPRALPAPGPCGPIGAMRPFDARPYGGPGDGPETTFSEGVGMGSERPWLASYPQGIPAEVDVDKYPSIVSVLEETCRQYADHPAFCNFGKRLTYAEVDQLSARFASYLLHELKLKKGDRVALMMPNILQYPIAIFGVLRAGLTVVNTNPMYTARELKHQLVDSGAAAIVVLENFAHVVQEVMAETPLRQVLVTGVGDMLGFPRGPLVNFVLRHVRRQVPEYSLPGSIRFNEALRLGARHELPRLDIRGHDIAFLQYTGGTTGVAKGAMLTHRNLVANMQQASMWLGSNATPGEEVIITA